MFANTWNNVVTWFKDRSERAKLISSFNDAARLSFITGFTIAITNPGMIIWWFVGFKLFADLNMFPVMTAPIKALFVFSGAFGLALYLTLEAMILHKYQKTFSEKFLYRANTFLFIILAFLILYFALKLVSLIFNVNLHLNF